MPPTKRSKNTKQSRVKARGQASRQQACGEREGQSLSHRGSSPNATQRISWANKAKDGKRSKPSTKARQKAAKRHRFSGKQRRGQAPALHVWSGQFAKKRAYSFPANTAPRVRATNCPRSLAEQRSVFGGRGAVPRVRRSRRTPPRSAVVAQSPAFGGRGAVQRIRTAKNRRRFLSLTSGKHLPNCRVGACLTVRPAFQSMIMVNHHLHSMAVMRKVS